MNEIHVFVSEDEHVEGVPESVETIKKALPNSLVHKFKNKGHFVLGDMGTDEFPELLEVVLQ